MAFGENKAVDEPNDSQGLAESAHQAEARGDTLKIKADTDFARAKLECMRNMGTIVTFTSAASFLVHRHPPILGSMGFAIALGMVLFLIALLGVHSAAELFLDAALQRFVDVRHKRWKRLGPRIFLWLLLMGAFICLASVPWFVMQGLPS